jgi:hypothetical protein
MIASQKRPAAFRSSVAGIALDGGSTIAIVKNHIDGTCLKIASYLQMSNTPSANFALTNHQRQRFGISNHIK